MQLSFNGFGPMAILLMVLTLVIYEAYKKIRQRQRHH